MTIPFNNRVAAALHSLQYCHQIELGTQHMSHGDPLRGVPPRRLTAPEAALRRNALEFLRNVISGEIDGSTLGMLGSDGMDSNAA